MYLRDVTWQALKYASYCSSLSKEDIRNIYQDYLTKEGINEPAEEKLSEFYEAEYEDILLNRSLSQRIVLVAVNFRKEVTSTVLWLLNYNINMQCFKVTPSRRGNELFVSFDQIIPMEEAEDYIIKMVEKAQDDISDANIKNSRDDLKYEFWIYLLEEMNKKSDLFRNISPQRSSWISTGSGIGGISYNFVISKSSPRVELYIDTGKKEENKAIFDFLIDRKQEIEEKFGDELIWQRKDDRRLCRIKYETKANGFDKEEWEKIANFMVDSMIKFEETLREHIEEVKRLLDNGNL